MIETPTNRTIRTAMQNAHTERAAAFAGAWQWLLGGRNSR